MALLHSRPSSFSSGISDEFSDEFASQDSIHSVAMASPEPPLSQSLIEDRDKYSDDHIRILHQIVVRAEEILSDLTPSSRLPTHALFKAYDEILPEHGIDPDEDQLISKLVFRIGGVKNTDSLKEKFKIIMARMEITVQEDDFQVHGSDGGDVYANSVAASDDYSIAGDTTNRLLIAEKNAHKESLRAVNGVRTDDGYVVLRRGDNYHGNMNGHTPSEDDSAEASRIEQLLESSAIAFQEKHHSKFSTMSTFRQWQKKSGYISNLCDQFDAARQADLEEDAEAKFNTWRALAAEVENLPPQYLPPGVCSKRIEEIALRTHEIHIAKTTIRRWRHNVAEQRRRAREIEESLDPLERVALKAHKYVMLSRAFTGWSNRLEEETKRAQMAAKLYEMSLKSKAFGVRQQQTEDVSAGGTSGAHIAGSNEAPKPSLDIVNTMSNVVDNAGSSKVAIDPRERISPGIHEKELPYNDPADSHDEMDEITLLARRHILRMRYYDVWEKYTMDHINKIKEFTAGQQNERLADAIPMWRLQAEQASRGRQILRYNAKKANYYNKVARTLDMWRQESQDRMQGQDLVLEDYAERANFYYKATKTLPIWRNETERAIQQQKVLELYAGRAEYYYGVTKSLPVWRTQAQEAVQHEEQTLARYAERADYYYKARDTLFAWHDLAKQKRKQRLKEAHLETRRIVKKGMGKRCIAQWREKLQPSLEQYEMMDAILEDITADQEWGQCVEAFDVWRERACEQNEMAIMSDTMVKGRILEQWRDQSAHQQELQAEAGEYWKEKALPQVLKNWNLRSLQTPNWPLIVANALEKKDRKLLRTSFEKWYSRTADKLVPVELPDGGYKSIEQIVEDAQHQASLNQARGLFDKWKAAAGSKSENIPPEVYTPTPGRPQIFLGNLSRRETTTPLAPVPSRLNFRVSETAVRGSAMGGRASRSGRPARNLRVSWAQ
ncbi:uncharacterized protein F4822DRAFT_422562 [Hypoxylon trugodes]|uniref:uncharacterized protein n=1 Tax=Hypoxylon trugodes TaxID=326681 RepID=UPI002190B8EF|nr:uncharacterized protein F4822DRAFT_422562 [Hypoxylon trugodes]KAI1382779.1 hypothetical protein F4822DRAFT_422562 [Hypoxylon trugodes]